jgi:hypothetical protein
VTRTPWGFDLEDAFDAFRERRRLRETTASMLAETRRLWVENPCKYPPCRRARGKRTRGLCEPHWEALLAYRTARDDREWQDAVIAHRARSLASARADPSPSSVYRLRDGNGRLLYVGVTFTATRHRRLGQHETTKSWWQDVDVEAIEWEHFPTRLEAEEAEARAIIVEDPVYNVVRPGEWTRRRLQVVGVL